MSQTTQVPGDEEVYKPSSNQKSRKVAAVRGFSKLGSLERLILVGLLKFGVSGGVFTVSDIRVTIKEEFGVNVDNRRFWDAFQRLKRRGILVKHGRGLYKLTKDYDESVLATADDAASKVKENLSSVRVVSEGGMPVVRFHAIGDFMNYLKSLAFFHYFSGLMLKQSVGYGRVYLGLSKRCIERELQRAKALASEAAEGRWVVGCHGFYGRRGFKRYSALMPLHFCAGRHAYEVGLDVYIDEELARELVAFVGRKPFLKMYLGSVKE